MRWFSGGRGALFMLHRSRAAGLSVRPLNAGVRRPIVA
jgi:hypothetical protein